ncbi:MAG: MarC family protein [Bacteroidales bacterium]|nr:MarC family protein [Bacteroidales bacterium]
MIEFFSQFSLSQIFGAFLVLFAIIDITGSIPIFLSLKQSGKKFSPTQATGISLLLFVLFFFMGDALLHLFGVDIQSFAVAGSIVLFIMAFEMILGVEIFKTEAGESGSSVVPIAFPLIAGPGALTTIISIRAEYADLNIMIALLLNIALDYLVLRYIDKLERLLGGTLITILRKFFGVILLAIGVKLLTTNLGSLISGLNV